MVAVIDPQVTLAYQNFCGRILNTLLGCAVGLTFLLVGGSNEWKLPLSMSATVLLSSYVFKVPLNWRIRTDYGGPHNRVRVGATFEDKRSGSRRAARGRGHFGLCRWHLGHMGNW